MSYAGEFIGDICDVVSDEMLSRARSNWVQRNTDSDIEEGLYASYTLWKRALVRRASSWSSGTCDKSETKALVTPASRISFA